MIEITISKISHIPSGLRQEGVTGECNSGNCRRHGKPACNVNQNVVSTCTMEQSYRTDKSKLTSYMYINTALFILMYCQVIIWNG